MGHISQIGFDGPLHRRTRRGVVADGIALLQGLIDRTGHRGMDGKGHHRSNLGEWTMADGDNLILGRQNDATNETTLHRASANGPGSALFVLNDNGQAIQGTGGANLPGVKGFSDSGDGVQGTTNSSSKSGIVGSNTSPNEPPVGSPSGAGVMGLTVCPKAAGVFGANTGTQGTGVQGNGPGTGVGGFSVNGTGLVGFSDNENGLFAQGGGWAAVLKGGLVVGKGPNPKAGQPNKVNGCIVINDGGSIFLNPDQAGVGGDIILAHADCAEDFDISAAAEGDPGSVMV